LLGGSTTISIDLDGFSDTDKHACHVHQVGSTGDQCTAAGAHFDGGDLGDLTADETGKVMTTFEEQRVTLVGSDSVIGRAVVVSSHVINILIPR